MPGRPPAGDTPDIRGKAPAGPVRSCCGPFRLCRSRGRSEALCSVMVVVGVSPSAITEAGPSPTAMSAAIQAMLASLSRTLGATRGREAGRLEMSGIDAGMEMLRCMRSSPCGSPCLRVPVSSSSIGHRLGVLPPSDETRHPAVGFLSVQGAVSLMQVPRAVKGQARSTGTGADLRLKNSTVSSSVSSRPSCRAPTRARIRRSGLIDAPAADAIVGILDAAGETG